MSHIEEDPILGRFFNTPEKKARWVSRLKIIYIIWILFVIIGFLFYIIWYMFT